MKKFIISFVLLFALVLVGCGSEDSSELKVKFNSNGGSSVEAILVPETGLIEEPEMPTKEGYVFMGWYLNGKEFDFSKKITKTITLKAKWAAGIKIYLETNEGVVEFMVPRDSTYELPIPERKGYNFIGWEDSFTEELIGEDYVFVEELHLVAKWKKKDSYSLYYLYNSKTIHSETVYEGEEYTPFEYNLEGHTFLGWYADEAFTEEFDFSNLARSNYLYAKFTPNKYTLSFSHSDETINVTYGERIGKLPTTSVTGCTFGGWEYNGKVITDVSKYLFTEDVTLNAILYTTSTFVVEGNSGTKVKYQIGDPTPYVNASKAGYIFAGWYDNSSFTGEPIYVIDSEKYANKTLYAKWLAGDDANNTYSTRVVELIKAYYTDLFEGSNIYEDIDFSNVDPFYGCELQWTSSNGAVILNDGRVLRGKYDSEVDLTIGIKYGKVNETITVNVNVKADAYQDLTEEKVVGAYVYTGTYNNRPVDDILLETANIIFFSFVAINSDGTLTVSADFKAKYESFKEAAYDAGVRVVASIGGGNASQNFDIVAANDYTRHVFATSCVELLEEYGFAGIDVDWEYPQEQNAKDYTALMKDLYEAVKEYDKESLVTSAIPAGPFSHPKFDLKNSAQYLDYINLMSYDLQCESVGGRAYHHSALFGSSMTYSGCNIEDSINLFRNSYGVPYNKIVIGAAFYGRMSTLNKAGGTIVKDGLFFGDSIRYNVIVSDYLSKSTVTVSWDSKAKAPYLFDSETNTFISYDNPESIKLKCEYVISKGVAGIFWWDYGSDSTGDLIQAVNEKLDILQ